MDLGIHTTSEALEDKLEERESETRRDLAWNLTRLPALSGLGPHRLFVAVGGVWQGLLRLEGRDPVEPRRHPLPLRASLRPTLLGRYPPGADEAIPRLHLQHPGAG